MGYSSRWSGEIWITPPVPWAKLKDSDWHRARTLMDKCIAIYLNEETEPTDEGVNIRRTGTRIVVCDSGDHSHYKMDTHLQEIVNELGPGYSFTGRLDAKGEDGARWRLKVIDGKVVQFEPEIVWPEESE